MKKLITILAVGIFFAMLVPQVSAETDTYHSNEKSATALGFADGAFIMISADADSAFIMIIGSGIFFMRSIDLEKGDFKWSMDHATLKVDGCTVEWDTYNPTKTDQFHMKIDNFASIHLVDNKQYRCADVTISCGCREFRLCGFGIVTHGVHSFMINIPD